VINYVDRQALSLVAPVLREQFQMSNLAYARIVSAFMLAYTVTSGISGQLIDRLGTRVGYTLFVIWWSVAAMTHSLATNAWTLGACRFLLGMGEAGNWPAGVRVVAEWFPPQERALASGIFNSGSSVGAVLATPLIAWLTLAFGWRAAFLVVGTSGFLWLLVWWPVYFVPVEFQPDNQSFRIPAGKLFCSRFVWSFTLAKVFMDPVWYFYIFWFPEYLKSARHFDLASIGKYGWIPFLAADCGNLLGGWFTGVLLRHGLSTTVARKASVTLFACLMTSAIPAVLTRDVRHTIALVSLATLGFTACNANMLAFPADVFPRNAVGSIWGLSSMGSGFGGMVFALLTGWAVDHYSYLPVFVGFGILPLASSAILWLLLGPLHPSAIADSHLQPVTPP
jgi:ACS family hexuronate transporter-like MFS transporter